MSALSRRVVSSAFATTLVLGVAPHAHAQWGGCGIADADRDGMDDRWDNCPTPATP